MPIQEVPPGSIVKELSEELKKLEAIRPPEWSYYVKTGAHKERPPEQPDWWYVRAASMLFRIYRDGPVGVSRLRTYYGGRKKRGSAPEHFHKAGGKILRTILQQLERAGFVIKTEREGRKITPKGAKTIEKISANIKSMARGG